MLYNTFSEKVADVLVWTNSYITMNYRSKVITGGIVMSIGKLGIFAAGLLFGTAGVKILTSKDAKKVYTHTTAAVLRAKESVMKTVTDVRENAGDILADAKEINEQRKEEEKPEVVEDESEECCCEEEKKDDCCGE
mgnify:CR=1 FL=1